MAAASEKITLATLQERKRSGTKITMLTAYDACFAEIAEAAGIDSLLVGDSVAMTVQGLDSTLPVTMDEMVYHTRLVARVAKRALVIGDMPFLSFQVSPEEAVKNAGRFLKVGGAAAVKLEGGARVARQIAAIAAADIPVVAHIGLTPQSVHKLGGFKVQRDEERLLADARAVEEAGAGLLVLEAMPSPIAARITKELAIPTIGIGAGALCDGQVLVLHDALGLFERFRPKFVKRYAELRREALAALAQYREEVLAGKFPGPEQTYG